MNLIPDRCIEFNEKRKFCIASQNGKTYRLENNSNFDIKKIKIDGCLDAKKEGEKRCDYLMEIQQIARVIYIELKGGDLSHALKQIHSSVLHLKSEYENFQIDARIVGSRDVPGFINIPNYRKLAILIGPKGKIGRSTNNFYSENI